MRNLQTLDRDDLDDYRTVVATRRPMTTREVLEQYEEAIGLAYDSYTSDIAEVLALEPLELLDPAHGNFLRGNYASLSNGRVLSDLAADLYEGANFRCPMCNFGQAASLDHFLPKATFPEFSILSRNLIPACFECNQKKGAQNSENFVHAYFDSIPDQELVTAAINWTPELSVSYRLADPPAGFDQVLYGKLSNQFDVLELSDRFSKEAGYVLSEIGRNCRPIFQRGGSAMVVQELQNQYGTASETYGINHYKSALLKALAADAAFCDGGFEQTINIP